MAYRISSLLPLAAFTRATRPCTAALLIGTSLLFTGCASWDWQGTGERSVAQLCRQSGNCRPYCDDAGGLPGTCRGAPRSPSGR